MRYPVAARKGATMRVPRSKREAVRMMGGTDSATLGADDVAAQPPRPAPRRLESAALLAGAREIEIDHHGELYRLRCTSKGKLILTK